MWCLLWVLLAIGSTAEDPLEVLVRHDQAGLQQVLGGSYGDGGRSGRQSSARVRDRVVSQRHRLSHSCQSVCCGSRNNRHSSRAWSCGGLFWSHWRRSGDGWW